jgi:hypothetical protein
MPIPAHEVPDEFAAIVFDHCQDRALINAKIVGVEPALSLSLSLSLFLFLSLVLDTTEINPHVRILMAEQRAEVDHLKAMEVIP